ncbi:MAG TPA: hypothetical protein ACFYEF_03115 [Candidatus Wunengus sp. YC63]|uniref:hypothetical protein n=1 Tax=Candidatus Wunengus sp. YC63 TaxID=3367699 RepID=UPI004025C227
MTTEERAGKKGMEIRIVYGSPMGNAFGVTGDKGGFFWSSNFLQVYKEFASRKASGVYADMNFLEIYSLTLLCMVARSFLINSVDVISEGITSRYLPSNSFEIFFFADVFGVGKCLMESIAFFRIVDMCCASNIYLNSDIISERVIKSLTV